MPTMTALPSDHPIMLAWEKYKASEEFANSFRWAAQEEHRSGSMWAAFLMGYEAAHAPTLEAAAKVAEEYARRMGEASEALEAAGKPNTVAASKSGAAFDLAQMIRALAKRLI